MAFRASWSLTPWGPMCPESAGPTPEESGRSLGTLGRDPRGDDCGGRRKESTEEFYPSEGGMRAPSVGGSKLYTEVE